VERRELDRLQGSYTAAVSGQTSKIFCGFGDGEQSSPCAPMPHDEDEAGDLLPGRKKELSLQVNTAKPGVYRLRLVIACAIDKNERVLTSQASEELWFVNRSAPGM